jgi:hypothetical protein
MRIPDPLSGIFFTLDPGSRDEKIRIRIQNTVYEDRSTFRYVPQIIVVLVTEKHADRNKNVYTETYIGRPVKKPADAILDGRGRGWRGRCRGSRGRGLVVRAGHRRGRRRGGVQVPGSSCAQPQAVAAAAVGDRRRWRQVGVRLLLVVVQLLLLLLLVAGGGEVRHGAHLNN